MRLEKGRLGKGTQGTLSPEPPGIFRLRAYRKDDSRKDDNTRVIVLPYKPPGSGRIPDLWLIRKPRWGRSWRGRRESSSGQLYSMSGVVAWRLHCLRARRYRPL